MQNESAGTKINIPVKGHMMQTDYFFKYRQMICSTVARILHPLGTVHDTEDCVSEIFLALGSKLPDFDPERGSEDTFIRVFSRSSALNYRKKLAKQKSELDGDEVFDCISSQIEMDDDINFKELVRDITAALSKEERLLFTMRYLYYYSADEAAEAFGIKKSAVEMRTMRLREKIRKNLVKRGVTV